MFRLLYRSIPSVTPSAVLLDIVRSAEHRNASLGASGILAYGPSAFAQVIEGPVAAVRGLASLIASDVRHRILWSHVCPVGCRAVSPDLPMGYAAVNELRHPLTGTDVDSDMARMHVLRVLLDAVADKYPSALSLSGKRP